MGILNSEFHYERVANDLYKCCLQKEDYGGCQEPECIVSYAKRCLLHCLRNSVTFEENGCEQIPYTDFKVYNEEDFEAGIAHILKICRSCKEDHFDNCIVNIIRNCYEIGLFGEAQKYKGNNLLYLKEINEHYPEKGSRITEEFRNTKLDDTNE